MERRREERSQSPLGDWKCLEAQAKLLEDNLAFSEVGAGWGAWREGRFHHGGMSVTWNR